MATPSLREKHAAETRERIVDVALALFADGGFDATTVDLIASRADVSPRTFFRYFPTKEALLFHGFDQRLFGITEHIEARPVDESPLETLTVVFCRMIEELRSGSERDELAFCLMAERPVARSYQHSTAIEHAQQEIIDALARRTGRSDTDPSLRAALSLAATCLDDALRDLAPTDGENGFEQHFRATLDAYRLALGQAGA